MRAFNRLAWLCSWAAPVGWTTAVVAFLLSLGTKAYGGLGSSAQGLLPLSCMIAALVGLIAHTILGLHVLKARMFSQAEREALWRDYVLGGGYQRWRDVMRRDGTSAKASSSAAVEQ